MDANPPIVLSCLIEFYQLLSPAILQQPPVQTGPYDKVSEIRYKGIGT
jgi:hypothetical protein